MSTSPCKESRVRWWGLVALSCLCTWAILLAASADAPAAEKTIPDAGQTRNQIQINADRLVAKMQDNMAEFIGNVQVTQGEATLKADRVTIYTKTPPKGADPVSPGIESIDRIVAAGNVAIKMQDGTAVAEQAEYQADKRILILTGPGTKVTKAGNSIAGSKITLYRDDGRINVDGEGRQRVQAVFVTESSVLE